MPMSDVLCNVHGMATNGKPRNTAESHYLTVAETAALLRASERWVRTRIKSGHIPHIRMGGKILVPFDRLRDMLNEDTA